MVREQLGLLNGKKSVFYGTFDRFGKRIYRGQYMGKTILLQNIRDKNGKVLTDHLWFRMGKQFDKLDLKRGDEVSFHARVDSYAKGGRNSDSYDYHLEYPEHLVKVNDPAQSKLSTDQEDALR